jgi:hypothetical protein
MQGRAAYFSGWMLTRSKPRTCRFRVSRLAAMRQFEGRTSAFRYLLFASG